MASAVATTTSPPPYITASTSDPTIEPTSHLTDATTSLAEKHQPQPRTLKYKTCIPLEKLGRFSVPTDCPVCGDREMTKVSYKVGGITHVVALAALGCTLVFFWVPYLMRSMKNVQHRCGNSDCDALLATWHRYGEGSVEVHRFE